MIKLSLSKKILFYSKHTLLPNDSLLAKINNNYISNNVISLTNATLQLSNRFAFITMTNNFISS
jgi:hypothetical protein